MYAPWANTLTYDTTPCCRGNLPLPSYDPQGDMVVFKCAAIAQRHHLVRLYEACVDRVQQAWPTTHESWDNNEARITQIAHQHSLRQPRLPLDQFLPEPASALVFALTYHVPSIVAGIVATLARIPEYRVWNPQPTGQYTPEMSDPLYRGARWDVLRRSERALAALHNGHASLRMVIADTCYLLSPSADYTPGCVRPGMCQRAYAALLRELQQLEAAALNISARPTPFRPESAPAPEPYRDALSALSILFNPTHLTEVGFCLVHRAHLIQWRERRRSDLWHTLESLAN
jgi:hypothetical protein